MTDYSKNVSVTERHATSLPKKAFDPEYMTEWREEAEYLTSVGIHHTYIHFKQPYNIRQYKYKKTPELFAALFTFYTQKQREREFAMLNTSINGATDVIRGSETDVAEIVKVHIYGNDA